MAKKQSMGRQKIKIAKIEIKNHLQVTFSKRRSGLFKKASELCTLCGVDIAIVVFSPAGKVFSFGHPNVESIIRRYITRNPNNAINLIDSQRGVTLCDLNFELTQLVNELESERKRGEILDNMRQVSQSQFWWEAPVEKLGFDELEQLRESMEELKKNVSHQANKILVENVASYSLTSFGGDGVRVFDDQFETKPTLINHASTTSNVHSFGYGNGLF